MALLDMDPPTTRETSEYVCDRYPVLSAELGELVLRVFSPSSRRIDEKELTPNVSVSYAPGWAQGVEANNRIARGMAVGGNMRFCVAESPLGDHEVADMVRFRTAILRVACDLMSSVYPTDQQIITGYSRGSFPAAVVAGERAGEIAGVNFVAPTWWGAEHTPASLALRASGEALGAMWFGSPGDRVDLIIMAYHAAREAMRRPSELKRDVDAIALEAHPEDLAGLLLAVKAVGVVICVSDGLCRNYELTDVARQIDASRQLGSGLDIAWVDSGHLRPFSKPQSRSEIIQQINRLSVAGKDYLTQAS